MSMAMGLDGIVAADTVLSDVDGEGGRLVIRGRTLDELVGRWTFEEAVALLWNGFFDDLPADTRSALGQARVVVFGEVAALDGGVLALPAMEAVRALTARLADGDDLGTALRLAGAPPPPRSSRATASKVSVSASPTASRPR